MKTNFCKLRSYLGWAGVLGIMIVPFFTVSGAVDIYMKVATIKGESKDKTFPGSGGWFDVLGWSWGMTSSAPDISGGAGAGKAVFKNLSVNKYVDSASPHLLLGALKGTRFTEANLVVRKALATFAYIKLDMKDVVVTGVSTSGNPAQDRLTEDLTFVFGSFTFTYTPQNNTDGSAGTAIPASWNIETNSP
jgi:type VI secretion system secreted protein Hcp